MIAVSRRLVSCSLIAILALSLWPRAGFVSLALAEEPQASDDFVVYSLQQQDLDGDGSPDLTVIDASFSAPQDQILVLDGAGDMLPAADWQRATDFDNDTWLFDAQADGDTDLIIRFTTQGNQHLAYLYDDQDGDGSVAYALREGTVEVLESRFWTVRAAAEGKWYNADGSINRNVTFSVDGPLGERGLDLEYVQALQVNDGHVDLEMECHTGSWQDMSAYCLTRLLVPYAGGIGRTKLRVAVPDYPLPEIRNFVFWPHLGPGLREPVAPLEIRPALKMDWRIARFDRPKGVDNLVQWVVPEEGWWLFSSRAVAKGKINPLDFENPFAHYDLARDRDGWAELAIRHAYAPSGTVWYRVGNRYRPLRDPRGLYQVVRYSWDQNNDGYWDYKLGLMGRNTVDDVVQFPDFRLVTIPYDAVPVVVTERMKWEGITFVQVELQRESSPEGVYDWDDILPLTREYMLGFGDALDYEPDDIRRHFRGEYRLAPASEPRLYLSPVDRKLHLVGAQAGIDRLTETRRMRYEDLDGDGYVDHWWVTVAPEASGQADALAEGGGEAAQRAEERTVSSLQVSQGLLLYGDERRIVVVRSRVDPSQFEALPPRDHAEWLGLGQQLQQWQPTFARDDLGAMVAQFPGFTTELEGATLRDFRLTDAGFRFVLAVRPECRVASDDLGIGLGGLRAGSYIVEYDALDDGGRFRVRPVIPARVSAPEGAISFLASQPRELAWSTVQVALHNRGLLDAPPMPVRLYALREGEETPLLLAEREVSVPGEGSRVLKQSWWPNAPGAWVLWAEVGEAGALPPGVEVGEMVPLRVQVAPAESPQLFQPLRRYDGMRLGGLVLALLAAAGAAAAAIAGLVLASPAAEREEEAALDQ